MVTLSRLFSNNSHYELSNTLNSLNENLDKAIAKCSPQEDVL